MTSFRPVVLAACFIYLAAVAQGRFSHALHIKSAQPDFPLLVLACAAVLLGGGRSVLLGLWAGLLTAAMLPHLYGTILASRLCAGAFAGFLNRFVIRDSLIVPPLAVLTVTLLAEAVTALVTPSLAVQAPRTWLIKTGGEMLYNAVLAVPVYLLLRKMGLGVAPEDPFRVNL